MTQPNYNLSENEQIALGLIAPAGGGGVGTLAGEPGGEDYGAMMRSMDDEATALDLGDDERLALGMPPTDNPKAIAETLKGLPSTLLMGLEAMEQTFSGLTLAAIDAAGLPRPGTEKGGRALTFGRPDFSMMGTAKGLTEQASRQWGGAAEASLRGDKGSIKNLQRIVQEESPLAPHPNLYKLPWYSPARLGRSVGEGIGQLPGFIAAGAAGGPAAVYAMAGSMGFQEGFERFKAERLEAGKDEATANKEAAVLGVVHGVGSAFWERLGLDKVLPGASRGQFLNTLTREAKKKWLQRGRDITEATLTEAVTETTQQAQQNILAFIAGADESLYQGLLESGVIGGIVGGAGRTGGVATGMALGAGKTNDEHRTSNNEQTIGGKGWKAEARGKLEGDFGEAAGREADRLFEWGKQAQAEGVEPGAWIREHKMEAWGKKLPGWERPDLEKVLEKVWPEVMPVVVIKAEPTKAEQTNIEPMNVEGTAKATATEQGHPAPAPGLEQAIPEGEFDPDDLPFTDEDFERVKRQKPGAVTPLAGVETGAGAGAEAIMPGIGGEEALKTEIVKPGAKIETKIEQTNRRTDEQTKGKAQPQPRPGKGMRVIETPGDVADRLWKAAGENAGRAVAMLDDEVKTAKREMMAKGLKPSERSRINERVKRLEQARPALVEQQKAAQQDKKKAKPKVVSRSLQEFEARPAKPRIEGKETTYFEQATGRRISTRYAIMELDDVEVSHDPYDFAPNVENFPPEVQGRDYEKNKGDQDKVLAIANALAPEALLSDTPAAEGAPPGVTPQGFTVIGNARTMGMKRAAGQNKAGWEAYQAALREKAAQFGLDPEKITGMKRPVLVRVLDIPAGEWVDTARNSDISGTGRKSSTDKAIDWARNLPPEIMEEVNLREEKGQLEPFSKVLTDRQRAPKIMRALVKAGVITTVERNEYMTDDGMPTEAARMLIPRAILATVFDGDFVRRVEGYPALQNRLINLAPELLRAKALQEGQSLDAGSDIVASFQSWANELMARGVAGLSGVGKSAWTQALERIGSGLYDVLPAADTMSGMRFLIEAKAPAQRTAIKLWNDNELGPWSRAKASEAGGGTIFGGEAMQVPALRPAAEWIRDNYLLDEKKPKPAGEDRLGETAKATAAGAGFGFLNVEGKPKENLKADQDKAAGPRRVETVEAGMDRSEPRSAAPSASESSTQDLERPFQNDQLSPLPSGVETRRAIIPSQSKYDAAWAIYPSLPERWRGKIVAMINQALRNVSGLAAALNTIREKNNITAAAVLDVKQPESMARKAMKRIETGQEEHPFSDVLRATIYFDDPGQIPGLIEAAVAALDGATVDNEWDKPMESGYRRVHVDARLADGQRVEIQFQPAGLDATNEQAHKIYDEMKAAEAKGTLTAEMKAEYLKRQREIWEPWYEGFVGAQGKTEKKKVKNKASRRDAEAQRTATTGAMTRERFEREMGEVWGHDKEDVAAIMAVMDGIAGWWERQQGEKTTGADFWAEKLGGTLGAAELRALDPALSEESLKQIAAWHGAAADFERFDTAFMGTGEGAQAYGWGLYFTSVKEIANHYAQTISNQTRRVIGVKSEISDRLSILLYDNYAFLSRYNNLTDNPYGAAILLSETRETIERLPINDSNNQLLEEVNALKPKDIELKKFPKALYTVNIHKGKEPGEYDYLGWRQGPSAAQIEKIKAQFRREYGTAEEVQAKIRSQFTEEGGELGKAWNLDSIVNGIKTFEEFDELNKTYEVDGAMVYDALEDALGSPREASLFLLRAGIDGIQYEADQGRQGEAWNYVVFDPAAITIEEKVLFQKTNDEGRTSKGEQTKGRAKTKEEIEAEQRLEMVRERLEPGREYSAPELRGLLGADVAHSLGLPFSQEQKTWRDVYRGQDLIQTAESLLEAAMPWMLRPSERAKWPARLRELTDEYNRIGRELAPYQNMEWENSGEGNKKGFKWPENFWKEYRALQAESERVWKELAPLRVHYQQQQSGARGAMRWDETGRAILYALQNKDRTTVVHEIGHVLRRVVTETDGEMGASLEAWAASEAKKRLTANRRGAEGAEKDTQRTAGQWTREMEEVFAEGWEKYLSTGRAPVKRLAAAFARMKELFRAVWGSLTRKGTPGAMTLPAEVVALFDRILTPVPGAEAIRSTTAGKTLEWDGEPWRVVRFIGRDGEPTDRAWAVAAVLKREGAETATAASRRDAEAQREPQEETVALPDLRLDYVAKEWRKDKKIMLADEGTVRGIAAAEATGAKRPGRKSLESVKDWTGVRVGVVTQQEAREIVKASQGKAIIIDIHSGAVGQVVEADPSSNLRIGGLRGGPAVLFQKKKPQWPELLKAFDQFDDTGEIQTIEDFVDMVDFLVSEDKAPEALGLAVDQYRDEQAYDRELAGRNDMDAAEEQFIAAVEAALGDTTDMGVLFQSGEPGAVERSGREAVKKSKAEALDTPEVKEQLRAVGRGLKDVIKRWFGTLEERLETGFGPEDRGKARTIYEALSRLRALDATLKAAIVEHLDKVFGKLEKEGAKLGLFGGKAHAAEQKTRLFRALDVTRIEDVDFEKKELRPVGAGLRRAGFLFDDEKTPGLQEGDVVWHFNDGKGVRILRKGVDLAASREIDQAQVDEWTAESEEAAAYMGFPDAGGFVGLIVGRAPEDLIQQYTAGKRSLAWQMMEVIPKEEVQGAFDALSPAAREIFFQYFDPKEETKRLIFDQELPALSQITQREQFDIQPGETKVSAVPHRPAETGSGLGALMRTVYNFTPFPYKYQAGLLAPDKMQTDVKKLSLEQRWQLGIDAVMNETASTVLSMSLKTWQAKDGLLPGYVEFSRGAVKEPSQLAKAIKRDWKKFRDMGIDPDEVIAALVGLKDKETGEPTKARVFWQIPKVVLEEITRLADQQGSLTSPEAAKVLKVTKTVFDRWLYYVNTGLLGRPSTTVRNSTSGALQYAAKAWEDWWRLVGEGVALGLARGDGREMQKEEAQRAMDELLGDVWALFGGGFVKVGDVPKHMFEKQLTKSAQMADDEDKTLLRRAVDTTLVPFNAVERHFKRAAFASVMGAHARAAFRQALKEGQAVEADRAAFMREFMIQMPQQAMQWKGAAINLGEGHGGNAWLDAWRKTGAFTFHYGDRPAMTRAIKEHRLGRLAIPFPDYMYFKWRLYGRYLNPMNVKALLPNNVIKAAKGTPLTHEERVDKFAKLMTGATMFGLAQLFLMLLGDDREGETLESGKFSYQYDTTGRIRVGRNRKGEDWWLRVMDQPFLGDTMAVRALFRGDVAPHDYIQESLAIGPAIKTGLLGLGFKTKYEQYRDVPSLMGKAAQVQFIPLQPWVYYAATSGAFGLWGDDPFVRKYWDTTGHPAADMWWGFAEGLPGLRQQLPAREDPATGELMERDAMLTNLSHWILNFKKTPMDREWVMEMDKMEAEIQREEEKIKREIEREMRGAQEQFARERRAKGGR